MPNKTLEKWSCSKLKEITSLKQSKDEVKSLLDSELVSFVPMECLGINKKYFNSKFEKPIKDLINKYVYFAENDVIMAKITPCFENGKIGIAKNLKNKIGFGSSEYLVFRPNKNVLNEYLYYYLNRNSFREIGAQNMQGAVGHKRLSKEFIEETLIYYPANIEEQQRIVKILDEAFENIEKAKQNALQNLNNAKELFESTLKNNCYNSNDDWKTNRADSFFILQRGYDLPVQERKKGKYPLISSNGVSDYINQYKIKAPAVVTGRSGTIGKVHYVNDDFWPLNTSLYIKDFKGNLPKFIYYFLQAMDLQKFSSGTGVPTLNRNYVHEVKISFPTLEEQQKIVAQLDELQEQTKRLEQIYEQKIKDLDELKQSILQKAFNGEL